MTITGFMFIVLPLLLAVAAGLAKHEVEAKAALDARIVALAARRYLGHGTPRQ